MLTTQDVIARLATVGVVWDGTRLHIPDPRFTMKKIAEQVNPKPSPATSKFFANSINDINPKRITPQLVLVQDALDRKIFRHAMSFWSVPISNGMGRQFRYIVWDCGNNRVIGIFGLADATLWLQLRNNLLGWTLEQRIKRIYNILNVFILGAVPPYNELLGAKLVALLSGSDPVRAECKRRFQNRITLKEQTVKPAELVMVETMGAFGKSVIYNRLKGWHFVGYTRGYSHIHLKATKLYQDIVRAVTERSNNDDFLRLLKSRQNYVPPHSVMLMRAALKVLKIPHTFTQTSVVRGYYVYPLAHNYREYLRGETDIPDYIGLPEDELIKYWKERWLVKRLGK